MSSKNKNLAYAVAGFLAVLYVMWAFFGGRGGAGSVAPAAQPSFPGSPAAYVSVPQTGPYSPSPVVPADPAVQVTPAAERQTYAMPQPDVAGLPPDALPGTRLEVWVAWDPPVTRAPKLQLLLKDVVLEKVIPGSIPEAPGVVLLSLRAKDIGDMLWADRYGAISVTLPN
jgi:hypothetical protein